MARLFQPFQLRSVTFRNRIVMSPMQQQQAAEGARASTWHLVHLGSRAIGGAGLIIMEATAVEPRGRITLQDIGLWDDGQLEPLLPIIEFCHQQGAKIGIQLGHAGRKAYRAERGYGPEPAVAPSAIPFAPDWAVPRALTVSEIKEIVEKFRAATERAARLPFDVLELHAAHGYLIHSFLSPLSNRREDEYGGSLRNRARLLLEVTEVMRAAWPADRPLFVRLSVSDYAEGGLTPADQVEVARWLRDLGVDLIVCSGGGITPDPAVQPGPGYQVPFAQTIRQAVGIPTGAIGLITDPIQAETILQAGAADVVVLAREFLRDPHWPLHAAHALGVDIEWPRPYVRAKPAR